MTKIPARMKRALFRKLSGISRMLLKRRIRITEIPRSEGEIGYTSEDNVIHLSVDNPFIDDLPLGEKLKFVRGIWVHETMHQILTDFNAMKVLISNDVISIMVYRDIFNIVEDARIENFAPVHIGGIYTEDKYDRHGKITQMSDLTFSKREMYKRSPGIDTPDPFGELPSPFQQITRAMIHYGDSGLIKGKFISEEANELFKKILPIYNECVEERNCQTVIGKSIQIAEILKPLWENNKVVVTIVTDELKKLKGGDHSTEGNIIIVGISASDCSDDNIPSVNRRSTTQRIESNGRSKAASVEDEASESNEQERLDGSGSTTGTESCTDEPENTKDDDNNNDNSEQPAETDDLAENTINEEPENDGSNEYNQLSAPAESPASEQADNVENDISNNDEENESEINGDPVLDNTSEEKEGQENNNEDENDIESNDISDDDAEGAPNFSSDSENVNNAEQSDDTGQTETPIQSTSSDDDFTDPDYEEEPDNCDEPENSDCNSENSSRLPEHTASGSPNVEQEVADSNSPGIRSDNDAINSNFAASPTKTMPDYEENELEIDGIEDYKVPDEELDSIVDELEELIHRSDKESVQLKDDSVPENLDIKCGEIEDVTVLNRNVRVVSDDADNTVTSETEQNIDVYSSYEIYDEVVAAMRPYIKTGMKSFQRLFRTDPDEKCHRTSGKLNIERHYSGNVSARMFDKNVVRHKASDFAVFLLIDESGSMSWDFRYKYAKLAAVGLAEMFEKLEIPLYVMGFTADGYVNDTGYDVIHHHYLKWVNNRKTRLSLLTISHHSNNFDGYSVRYAYNILKKRKEPNKILIVISDGCPASFRYDEDGIGIADTRSAVNEARRSSTVLGVSIGGSCIAESLKMIYGNGLLTVNDLSELFLNISSKLRKIVKQEI